MLINFTKMHGLGNDFVIIDGLTQAIHLHSHHCQQIANRRFGVGCDQVIILEPPVRPEADFFYRVYNADGSEARQCFNGARCAAKFAENLGLVAKKKMAADCLGGAVTFTITGRAQVSLEIEMPEQPYKPLKVEGEEAVSQLYHVSLGNQHCVCFVNNLSDIKIESLRDRLCQQHPIVKDSNFIVSQVLDESQAHARVVERGVGITLACGSGAAAAALVGHHLGYLADSHKIAFEHGKLAFQIDRQNNLFRQQGPTSTVFAGFFRSNTEG